MKKLLQKNKELLIDLTLLIIGVTLLFAFLEIKDLSFGKTSSDFAAQHIRFIDYFRESFWKTKDLIPSLNTNFGGGQNMANFFYHGLTNPFIILSYFLPFISTRLLVAGMYYFTIILSFLAGYILLRKFDVNRTNRIILSVVIAFAPAIISHFSVHIMFFYYYPYFIFSLVALLYLIEKNKIWPFIILTTLVVYTNFFFALVVGFSQLVFFIAYIHFKANIDKKEIIKKYKKLILSYLVVSLLSMLVLLPQLFVIMSSSRQGGLSNMAFLSLDQFDQLVLSKDIRGGFIVFYAIVLAGINYKDKFSSLIVIAVLLASFIIPLNYLFNFFQYAHSKIFIYLLPLLIFIVGYCISKLSTKKNIIALITSMILFLIYIFVEGGYKNEIYFESFITSNLILGLVFLVSFINIKKVKLRYILIVVFSLIYVYSTLNSDMKVYELISDKDYNSKISLTYKKNKNYYLDKKEDFTRNNTSLNFVSAINEYSPLTYSSLENSNYLDSLKEYAISNYKHERRFNPSAIDNKLSASILGVAKSNYKKDEIIYNNSRPFIYGVENKNTVKQSLYSNVVREDRLLVLNSMFFSENGVSNDLLDYTKKELVYENKEDFKVSNNEIEIPIAKKFQKNGTFIINVLSKDEVKDIITISSQRDKTLLTKKNFYGELAKSNVYLNIDAKENQDKITISFDDKDNVYSLLRVYYVDAKEYTNKSMDYIKTTSNKVRYNEGYSFNLKMNSEGYLGTAIPFDKGFIIKDNGKVIKNEKVNNYYLGAKLSKGDHKITIDYEIPGYKLGLIISLVGMFILGFIMIREIKFFNRPFFRFVLVGVFNTVNYYVAYTILLKMAPYMAAHVIGFLYSAVCSYFITTYYTFNTKPSWKTFIAFPLTFLPNLILSSLGTMALVELHILDKSIASLIMMIAVIPVTFIINKIIFTNKKE